MKHALHLYIKESHPGLLTFYSSDYLSKYASGPTPPLQQASCLAPGKTILINRRREINGPSVFQYTQKGCTHFRILFEFPFRIRRPALVTEKCQMRRIYFGFGSTLTAPNTAVVFVRPKNTKSPAHPLIDNLCFFS